MQLLLAMRHLETQDNQEQRFSSGDRDVPILPDQQMPGDILESLRGLGREKLVIVHTGLRRSTETAHLLVRSLSHSGQPLIIPQFRERFGGRLAGLKFSELQQLFPGLRSPNEFWGVEAPDRGLESAEAFLSRIEKGLTQLTLAMPPYCVPLLVAHAGSIKGIKAILTAQSVDERKQILCEPTPHSELFEFEIDRRSQWQGREI